MSYTQKYTTQKRKPVGETTRMQRFLGGAIVSTVISILAYRRGSLSKGGAFGAVGIGTAVTWRGGIGHAATVISFFVSSSIFSRIRPRHVEPAVQDDTIRDSTRYTRRNLTQVLANGIVPTLWIVRGSGPPISAGFIGAIAAVTADTWATEIGRRSVAPPRSIVTGRVVSFGESGGVTQLGTIASIMGGACIGLTATITRGIDPGLRLISSTQNVAIGCIAGAVGSTVDSLLGATVQIRYRCEQCHRISETRSLCCGELMQRYRGVPGIDNDMVNLLTSLSGVIVGVAINRYSRRNK